MHGHYHLLTYQCMLYNRFNLLNMLYQAVRMCACFALSVALQSHSFFLCKKILYIQYSIYRTKSVDTHALHTLSSLHLLFPHIATTASAVGIPEATIKILGRWRSMAYQQYVRPSAFTLAGVAPACFFSLLCKSGLSTFNIG